MKTSSTGVFLLFLLLLCLTGRVQAADPIFSAQAEALDLDGLQEAAGGLLPRLDLEDGIDLEEGIGCILNTGSAELPGILRKAVKSGVLLLTVVLLCSLAEGFRAGAGNVQALDMVSLVGALSITAVAVSDVHALIGLGRAAVNRMSLFSKVLLPTVTAAAAASGSPGSGAARQVATMFFSDLLLTMMNGLLLPLVHAYLAASVAYAAVGNEGLKRIAGGLKWAVTAILTSVLLLFVGYLTISGAVAGTADATSIKAAKFAMSSLVPVVGGILSDAAETVLAGAGILKNLVGVFGMLAVLALCVAPFLQLGVHYLSYKLAAALSATVSNGRIAGLIDAIGAAFGLVLGMTGTGALVLLISMVSAISAVTG